MPSRSRKSKCASSERDAEMQSLLAKLKELVPNMPSDKKLSKLEIIRHVIDYIVDLQIALETHPSAKATSPPRRPLEVLSPASNASSTRETNRTEKHIPDLESNTRPVSC